MYDIILKSISSIFIFVSSILVFSPIKVLTFLYLECIKIYDEIVNIIEIKKIIAPIIDIN